MDWQHCETCFDVGFHFFSSCVQDYGKLYEPPVESEAGAGAQLKECIRESSLQLFPRRVSGAVTWAHELRMELLDFIRKQGNRLRRSFRKMHAADDSPQPSCAGGAEGAGQGVGDPCMAAAEKDHHAVRGFECKRLIVQERVRCPAFRVEKKLPGGRLWRACSSGSPPS